MITLSPRQRPPRAPDRREAAIRHFPYIEQIARRLRRRLPRYVPLEDMVSAGFVGLMESVDRFDPRRSVSFDSFAEFRIKGAILDALRAADPLSRDQRAAFLELRRARHRLLGRLGRDPEPEELAQELGCDLDRFYELTMRVALTRPLSLPAEMPSVERPSLPGPGADCYSSERWALIHEAIALLPERLCQIITLHYYEDLTLREIGEILHVTESRVCQLHAEAVALLRRHLGDF